MAVNSVNFSGSTYASRQTLYLEFWLVSQDVNNNRSTLGYKLWAKSNVSGASAYDALGKYSFSGAMTVAQTTKALSWNYNNAQVIAEGTFIKNHNADGSLANQTLTGFAQYSSATATVSVTLSIPTIKRASKISSVTGTVLGNPITVNISRESSSFTHVLWYRMQGSTGWTRVAENVATQQTFTPPITLANNIPNSESGNLELKIDTYNGTFSQGNLLGSNIFNQTVTVHSTALPTLNPTIAQTDSAIQSKFLGYVKGKSRVKVYTNAEGSYGSTIKERKTTVNGITYPHINFDTNVLTTAGVIPITIEVTDSRGRKATYSTNITVIDYFSPRINLFTVERTDANGNPKPTGTYAKVTYNGSIAPVNNRNDKGFTVRYRKKGTTTWTFPVSRTDVYSLNSSTIVSGLTVSDSYEFGFVVNDYFTSNTFEAELGTGFYPLTWKTDGTKGIGIGKVAEREGIDFGEMPMVNGIKIVESGPNWMKFLDGTLIMTMTTGASLAWSKAVTATVNLPLSAINANYQVMLSYAYDLPDAIRGKTTIHARNKTTSSFGIVMQTQDNFFDATNAAAVRIDCVIYARWK